MSFIKNIENTLKMNTFVSIAICFSELYEQKYFRHNSKTFWLDLKQFQHQSPYIRGDFANNSK